MSIVYIVSQYFIIFIINKNNNLFECLKIILYKIYFILGIFQVTFYLKLVFIFFS